ncbi:MAG: ABC transporter permease [Sphingobacterium sp.]
MWRNLIKNKVYSSINIIGLTIGMAASILITLWIQKELSMDQFHEKAERLYVMYNRDSDPIGNNWASSSTPRILAPTLKADYEEVEMVSRFGGNNFLLTVGDKKLNTNGAFVDSTFLSMFTFPLIAGETKTALTNPHSIVLTEDFAKTLFADASPVGKIIKIDSIHQFTVTGVLESLPNNTTFNFNYLLPWSYVKELGWDNAYWGNNSTMTYTLLKEGSSQTAFDEKIKNISREHTKNAPVPLTAEVFTQRLDRYYLYNKSENGYLVAGNLVTVRLFAVIAGFILLIACINFMNLSTARSEKRAKEVGIRKVVGVSKRGLIIQFIFESVFLSTVAFVSALLVVYLLLPWFSQLVNTKLDVPLSNPQFWLSGIAFILFTGLLAGSYPAFYLSSFNPIKVLKGTVRTKKSSVAPRKILVVIQFSFAIILIISTIVISNQIKYGINRDADYDRSQLIHLPIKGDLSRHFSSLKNELLSSGAASSITVNNGPITRRSSDSWGFEWEGSTLDDVQTTFIRLGSDADFIQTMGLELVEGRDIDIYKHPNDSSAVLINESALKIMHLTNPIGKRISYKDGDEYYTIIGVIKDFLIESPFEEKISPIMVTGPGSYFQSTIHIKLTSQYATQEAIGEVKKVFHKFNPDYPFEYTFIDESYAQKFQKSERTNNLVTLFAGLTIFISCLGLFGLAAYMAENKTKEIGIRKVLGASMMSVTRLLSKEFLQLVLIAILIASPIAWYIMHKWMQDYSYQIGIQWWVFLLTAVVAITITVITIGWQSIKAALANPVNSLRDE